MPERIPYVSIVQIVSIYGYESRGGGAAFALTAICISITPAGATPADQQE